MDGRPLIILLVLRPTRAAQRAVAGLILPVLGAAAAAMPTAVPPADPATPGILARPPGTPLYNWLSSSLPTLLIVAGGLLVVSVLLARAKSAKAPKPPSLEERFARLAGERAAREADRQAASAPPHAYTTRSQATAPGARPSTEAALDAVIRDAEELAQRLAVAMDARAARLETLIREADDRLRRLEAARGVTPPNVVDTQVFEPRRPDAARATLPVASRAPAPSFDAEADDPVHRQVFDLADQGLPALDIARRLGQPTGQIELILALRGR